MSDAIRSVKVGGIAVLDATYLEACSIAASGMKTGVVFSLHIGGLNVRRDVRYCQAMGHSAPALADGVAVVLLARLAGATRVERAPTTDLGIDVLRRLSERLGRAPRVVLLGGPRGLAQRAAAGLGLRLPVDIVGCWPGFGDGPDSFLDALPALAPDVVFVGLGMPREAIWVDEHRDKLAGHLIITCGGWFGFLAGDEKRAPAWMRRLGCEWVARLVQAPSRLAARYFKGSLTFLALVPGQVRMRMRMRGDRLAPPG